MKRNYVNKKFNTIKNILKVYSFIWDNKIIWWFSASSRVKARFSRTVLGGFWQGISNISFIIALAIVYGAVFKVSNFIEYLIYLGLGFVTWIYVSNSFIDAPELFQRNSSQIHNTNTDYIIYAMEDWAFQYQNFIQSLILVLGVLSFIKFKVLINFLTFGIVPLINIILFSFWFPLLISLAGIRYKDFYQLIPIFNQLIFLLSPFLYEEKDLGSLNWISDLNPFYQIIAQFRDSIIIGKFDFKISISIFIINFLGISFSIYLLDKFKKRIPFLI